MHRKELRPGDIILYEGGGPLARLLRWVQGERYPHMAMVVAVYGNLGMRIAESVPFLGPRFDLLPWKSFSTGGFIPVAVFRPKMRVRAMLLGTFPREGRYGWRTVLDRMCGREPTPRRRGLTAPELMSWILANDPLFCADARILEGHARSADFAPQGRLEALGMGHTEILG